MNNLTYKSVDVMKKSKDTVTNQLTTAEKQNLVACLATLGITHVAISVPMDDQASFIAFGSTPSPRTISGETQDWCDVIHAQKSIYGKPLNVIHRGTLCGAEAIYGAGFLDGSVSIGVHTDGSTATLCGRFNIYLNTNVGTGHVLDGDIFAPIPEGTQHAFDVPTPHPWWPAGTQANYDAAFAAFHQCVNDFATASGKSLTFMSHNNFSEPASGWIDRTLFTDQNLVGCDYYGQRQGSTKVQPSDYVTDWQQLYLGKDSNGGGNNNAGGFNQFWGEWGDLPSAVPAGIENTIDGWATWLRSFYTAITNNLIPPNGHLIGFNYWGGWEGQNTSILTKTGSGANSKYSLNFRGVILQQFLSSPATQSKSTDTMTTQSKSSATWTNTLHS